VVAYSNKFCLPCFEPDDSPCVNTGTLCDPSTVWCDLVGIVDTQLGLIDSVLARTVETIPLASVTGTQVSETFPGVVIFDTVEYDTDNMVNLDVNANLITPTRSGIYMAFGYVEIPAQPTYADGAQQRLHILSGTDELIRVTPEVSVNDEAPFWISTQQPFQWTLGTSGPFSLSVEVLEVPLVRARLSVWWVADLP
jgi:hypothetical protein